METGTIVTILSPAPKGKNPRRFMDQTGTIIGRSSLHRGAVVVRFANGDQADYYPHELKVVTK